jgi:hypothetical protein
VVALAASCGDDGGTGPSEAEPEPGTGTAATFGGTLAGGGISGELELTIAGSAAAATRMATLPQFRVSGARVIVSVTGCLYLGGSCVALTGTYDTQTKALNVSGGGYTFTGTWANGRIEGTFTGPGVDGLFVVHGSTRETVQVYCGTYTGDSDGIWNLVRRASVLSGVYNDVSGDSGELSGTLNNNAVSVSFTGGSASGTLSGSVMSGTWQTADGSSGTWSGTLNGCRG